MHSSLRWLVVVALAAGSAQARSVVFSAPPALRPAVKKAIEAQGFEAIDASAIDDGLFNDKTCAKNQILAGKFDLKPVAMLPAETQEDWRRGLAGCKARIAKEKSAAERCADEFAQAVWQRYLENVRPERVIEFRPPRRTKTGKVELEGATYLPESSTVVVLSPSGDSPEQLVTAAVTSIFTGEMDGFEGVRPNSDLIPGDVAPPRPDLKQGNVQALEPEQFTIPAKCPLPAKVEFTPADAPLAKTLAALWNATVKGHPKTAPAGKCALSIDGSPTAGSLHLTIWCGHSNFETELFAGTRFADDAFQARLAHAFIATEIGGRCFEPTRDP